MCADGEPDHICLDLLFADAFPRVNWNYRCSNMFFQICLFWNPINQAIKRYSMVVSSCIIAIIALIIRIITAAYCCSPSKNIMFALIVLSILHRVVASPLSQFKVVPRACKLIYKPTWVSGAPPSRGRISSFCDAKWRECPASKWHVARSPKTSAVHVRAGASLGH